MEHQTVRTDCNRERSRRASPSDGATKDGDDDDPDSSSLPPPPSLGPFHGVLASVQEAWTWFFYARTTDLRLVAALRAAYATIVLVQLGLLWLDLDWFLKVMPTPLARQTVDPDALCLFALFANPLLWPKVAVGLWALHAALLGLQWYPRWQAAGVFFWQVQMAHHNALLWNGEDYVTRLLAFFMIFYPSHAVSVSVWRRQDPEDSHKRSWPMWPFRLVQIQMCLIFFSAGSLKAVGTAWREGYALHQVVHNDALYGGWFNPDWMFGYTGPLYVLTRATVVLELGVLPFLWIRRTLPFALIAVLGFHFMLDASMNLNMFHWVMMVGWCTFLVQPSLPPAEVQ